MRAMLCFLTFLASASFAPAADNWPQFRGPDGDGRTGATGLPLKFGESEHVKWKTPIHGKGWSSPVIWENQIWVTTAPEDGKQLSAVCVARDSGKIVHEVVVFEVPEPAFCHPMNSYATPTPVIEEGRVYVHYGSAGTACLDTSTGKTIWTRQDLPCDHFRGPASSPILYRNLLIVNFDGFDLQYVVAFDKQTGKTVWKQNRELDYTGVDGDNKKAYGTPAIIEVDGEPQLISPAALATFAYEPLTGKELWRVRHGGMNVSARPLFGHGMVYLNTGAGGDKMLAVKLGGHGDVTPSHIVWKHAPGAPTRPSQLLVGDLLFMISDTGIASCLDAKTGEQIWQQRLDGKYSASPIYSEGRIYFFSEEGEVPVIEASREFKVLAVNKFDAGFMASPAVSGKALFLRTKSHLYRIER
jgi:outer membrane protein assembly factor BamB